MEKSFANTDRRKQVSKNRSKNTRKITFFWTTYETVFKDDFLDFLCSKRYRFGEISDGRWLCWNTFFSKMSSKNIQNRCGPSETLIKNMTQTMHHKGCLFSEFHKISAVLSIKLISARIEQSLLDKNSTNVQKCKGSKI